MKKHLLYLFFTFFASTITYAQEKFVRPNFDSIEAAVKNKEGEFYFAKLMERYKTHDTTLTIKDYVHLYYGYEMQDSYTAPKESIDKDKLKKAQQKEDWGEYGRLQKQVVEANPFDLREIYFLSQALERIGLVGEAAGYKNRVLKLVDAIATTGDGLSVETGYYVTKVAHEYDMMAFLGFDRGGGQALLKGKYGSVDKLLVAKNDKKIDALYFNVTLVFRAYGKIFK